MSAKKKKTAPKKKSVPQKKKVKPVFNPELIAEAVQTEPELNEQPQHQCTAECLPSKKLKGNSMRMMTSNYKVKYVLAFEPQIDRRIDGHTTVIIGSEESTCLRVDGISTHEAMMKMFTLLVG